MSILDPDDIFSKETENKIFNMLFNKTEKKINTQEQFWQGQFGDDYTARNINLVENNYQMFKKIFKGDYEGQGGYVNRYQLNIKSIIEFGAGSGQNILALQRIFPGSIFHAIEINSKACEELKKIWHLNVHQSSILDWNYDFKCDLVLSKGLLIHIHPDNIEKAYDVLYNASNKYILLCEYYSPARTMIPYRGEIDKLWKADFAGEMLDKYSDLCLVDYGFVYYHDKYPQDSLNWWLLSK